MTFILFLMYCIITPSIIKWLPYSKKWIVGLIIAPIVTLISFIILIIVLNFISENILGMMNKEFFNFILFHAGFLVILLPVNIYLIYRK
jgi:Na+-transporting NADH:ubiquinone oxidoreductase subunit NqrB